MALVDDAAAAPTTNVDVIVVAPSVDLATLAAKYKDVTIPVVTLASGTWQASGLTNAAPTSGSGTSTHVADAVHPVAAGETGTVTVLTSSDSLARAPASSVGAGARRVWVASSGSTDAVVTAYDTGTSRPTSPASVAPARPVAVGYSAGAVGKLNADGWSVVDAAVSWADGNPLVPVAGVTSFDFDAFEQLRTVTPPSPATASSYSYDATTRVGSGTLDGHWSKRRACRRLSACCRTGLRGQYSKHVDKSTRVDRFSSSSVSEHGGHHWMRNSLPAGGQ